MSAAIRTVVPLVIGLVVGGVGASLFSDSLPGEKGTAEERASNAEAELKKAENRIAALEGSGKTGRRERTLREGFGDIAQRLRHGEKVTPDDLLRATQPLARDLAPVFERMHAKQLHQHYDALAGEVARKYHLDEAQQAKVEAWFDEQAELQSKRWMDEVGREGTTMSQLVESAQNVRADEGLDEFMGGLLQGDELKAFRADRLQEKVGRVQDYADMRVQRVDDVVGLDDNQRDQLFGAMAASSPDYEPAMKFTGGNGLIDAPTGLSRDQAIESVLRPEQKQAFEAFKAEQREKVSREMADFGLSIPDNWDPLNW